MYEHEPANNNNNNNNNNMRFCVLFFKEIGAHSPTQSKEPKHSQKKPPFPNTSSEEKKDQNSNSSSLGNIYYHELLTYSAFRLLFFILFLKRDFSENSHVVFCPDK